MFCVLRVACRLILCACQSSGACQLNDNDDDDDDDVTFIVLSRDVPSPPEVLFLVEGEGLLRHNPM